MLLRARRQLLRPPLFRSLSRRAIPQPISRQIRRQFATGANNNGSSGDGGEMYFNDDFVPFEGLPSTFSARRLPIPVERGSHSLALLPLWDPTALVKLEQGLIEAEPTKLRASAGFGGHLSELYATFDACLQVGRFERSASLLKSLIEAIPGNTTDLLAAHNQYLRKIVEHSMVHKSDSILRDIQRWYEVDFAGPGKLLPDATTYAFMLKACLQLSTGAKMERTVRRYMSQAANRGLDREVLALPILSDRELDKVARICPMDWAPVDQVKFHSMIDLPTSKENLPKAQDEHPVVIPVEAPPMGLDQIKSSLSLFNESVKIPSELENVIDESSLAYQYLRQKKLEEDTVKSSIERWRSEVETLKQVKQTDPAWWQPTVNSMLWGWVTEMSAKIETELKLIEQAEDMSSKERKQAEHDRCLYGPFLRLMDPPRLAAISILSTLGQLTFIGVDRGIPTLSVMKRIAEAFHDECAAEAVRTADKKTWTNASAKLKRRLIRQTKFSNAFKHGLTATIPMGPSARPQLVFDEMQEWSTAVKAKIGGVLLKIMIESAKVETDVEDIHGHVSKVSQAALYTAFERTREKNVGMLKVNSALVDILKREPAAGVYAKFLPMLVPPKPWKSYKDGGYLFYKNPAVRFKGSQEQQEYAQAASSQGDMDQVYAGLNVLGKTAWRINTQLFDIMRTAWNTGEAIANFPPEYPDLEIPPEPASPISRKDRLLWKQEKQIIENKISGYRSDRCFFNYQLEIASAIRHETFYFPHNVDYRGRAYPIPPHLNHMGADHCRGLLMFAEGRELGDRGLQWLKIHLSNVFGFDKASFAEREQFTMDHLEDIKDSATNPLGGAKWWLKAEVPWQCLAACIELNAALQLEDPRHYQSHLAIHQDGTCNGLQHYAALGGDTMGAKQVNLEPSDRPQDVYSAVAQLVSAAIAKDAAEGSTNALLVNGKITRKVVKTTVMTNVYGVTYIGARDQVKEKLEVLIPDLKFAQYNALSGYVARKIFKALATMFNGAHEIQNWFNECASRISTSLTAEQVENIAAENAGKIKPKPKKKGQKTPPEKMRFMSSVIWTTPLKMPVVQPYRGSKAIVIPTNLQSVSIREPVKTDPVNRRRQLQGFAPNFVHSLDATHMLLSALKSSEIGINFAAVHDSFWTHACDIDKMNVILREAFIGLHSEDIIGRLKEEFEERYKGYIFLKHVDTSSVLGQKILKMNRYKKLEHTRDETNAKFAKSGKEREVVPLLRDLLEERERMRLLSSDNEDDRKRGEEMITPGQLFQESQSSDLLPQKKPAEDGAEKASTAGLSSHDTTPTKTHELNMAEDESMADTLTTEPSSSPASLSDDANDPIAELLSNPKGEGRMMEHLATQNRKGHMVWVPLTFPDVPQKGDFDVTRLRESPYFFS
jgi:DNA-directed RNA polymerase